MSTNFEKIAGGMRVIQSNYETDFASLALTPFTSSDMREAFSYLFVQINAIAEAVEELAEAEILRRDEVPPC